MKTIMTVKTKPLLLALTLLSVSAATIAANDNSTKTKQQTKTTNPATEQSTAKAANKDTGAPTQAANNDNKDDTFIPSEAISEDLAVSFPVDI